MRNILKKILVYFENKLKKIDKDKYMHVLLCGLIYELLFLFLLKNISFYLALPLAMTVVLFVVFAKEYWIKNIPDISNITASFVGIILFGVPLWCFCD